MALSAGCIGVGIAVSLFQVRGLYMVAAFVPPVAAVAIWRIVEALRAGRLGGFRAAGAILAVVAFFGPVWTAPALAVRQIAPPLAQPDRAPSDCLLKRNLSVLDSLPKGLVLNPIGLGAYTLFYTRHSIIAEGFHRAPEGIVAGIDAFEGSEADMRRVVRTHAPDYVVVCSDWAKLHSAAPKPFATALAEGAAAPPWLERVPLEAGALMVWRVRPEALLRP
jgi:hypothetical protein